MKNILMRKYYHMFQTVQMSDWYAVGIQTKADKETLL